MVKFEYKGEELHVEITADEINGQGQLLVENIEAKLFDWGIVEINEINPDEGKTRRLWVDSGDKNIYVWDDKLTQEIKSTLHGVFKPQGKLNDFINLENESHKEFLVWYYGGTLEEAIKEMEQDCK